MVGAVLPVLVLMMLPAGDDVDDDDECEGMPGLTNEVMA